MSTDRYTRRACMGVILATLFLAGADWPTYRHDNRRTGVTAEQLSPPLSASWIFRSPSPPASGWARPVDGYGATKNAPNVSYDDAPRMTVVGNTVTFASSAENMIYAIDADKGDVLWTFHTDGPPRLAPTLWQGKAYFGADDGTAYCLDAADGSVVWTVDAAPTDEKMLGTGRFTSLWPLRTGVMVENNRAYFTAGLFPSEGIYFFAVDAEDGRILWRRQLDNGGVGSNSPQGYLLASDDSIWMTSRVAPRRWNLADGSPIDFQTPIPHHEWRFHNGGSYAQLWGDNIVYGQAGLLAYDPNGQWTDKYNRTQQGRLVFNWFNARRAVFHNGMAYVATDHHVMAVRQAMLPELAKAECKEFEETYKRLRVASHLTALESLAEHGKDSPIGRRLKETTLKYGRANYEQWPAAAEKIFAKFAKKAAWMLPRKANESMILAGNVIYAGGESEVLAIDAATGKLLWSDSTDSRVRGLAVANGRLLVSTIDGSVRCYVPETETKEPKEVYPRQPNGPLPKGPLADHYADTAEHIVDGSDVREGYCLILGANEAGRLALEIARRTRLNVYVVEPDAKKVAQVRASLTEAGLYGGRISVEQGDTKRLPFPPYVFNLVICARPFPGRQVSFDAEEIFRVTKPCGGVAYVGLPLQRNESISDLHWMERLGAKVTIDGDWTKLVRGRVLGSADWTHNYATAANTYCNEDPLVKGPFGILWYGPPGPRDRVERHAAGPLPLVVGSTMFLTGYDRVMAYDIYNGVCYWNRTILGATRTGLPMGTSNLVADDDGLFIVIDNKTCLQLDAISGETTATYPAPETPDAEHAYWGWIAKTGHLLLGSRNEHDASRRRADPKMAGAIFAIDIAKDGKLQWIVEGKRIEHDG
ncbi:MAG: PQQ-binding-like beta-propeller repeat protein, partial [Thermoguttaceae bacterium]